MAAVAQALADSVDDDDKDYEWEHAYLKHLAEKVGDIDTETIERIGWLVGDDDQGINRVRKVILSAKYAKFHLKAAKSAADRDHYEEISTLASRLAELLGDKHRLTDSLLNMSAKSSALAKHYDPKGKPTPRNHVERFIAESLCHEIYDGLDVPLRTNPDSELAKLFRLCCKAAGKGEPKNAAHYLKPYVEEIRRRRERSRKMAAQGDLLEQALNGDLSVEEFRAQIGGIQKDK
jgi:hypothetical protein